MTKFKEIDGGLCAPKGFNASGVNAKIKNLESTKKDCALVVSEVPAVIAGTFTTNVMKSPPVYWNVDRCAEGVGQAMFINSGNANACTGERGMADVETTVRTVADRLGIAPEAVCIASTGVIGVPLPMDRILQGVEGCLEALSETGSNDAALAIMTTDTVPKERAVEIPLSTGNVRIGAIAKGSGMIAPNMATMICVITTDANIAAKDLDPLLKSCVQGSFNQICIDNDMSTSDTVLCLANGLAGEAIVPDSEDFLKFSIALGEVCVHMAKALVKDGEGASKFIEIQVEGAASDEEAKTIARSIAFSQLCKTAFFGEDPNWGRFACAAGYAGIPYEPADLKLWLGDVQLVDGGMPTEFLEEDAAAIMQARDILLRVSIGDRSGKATFWTSDLSHDYVTINADYRT